MLGVGAADFCHVGAGFTEWWNGAVALDGLRAGVVRGEGQGEIVVIAVEQGAEIVRAGVDIFRGIEDVFYAELGSGVGEELHQAAGVAARDGFGVEIGLSRR